MGADGYVDVDVREEMHGLPQANTLAQELLCKHFGIHGYAQSRVLKRLWTNEWHPIQIMLVVNDFAVKYVGKEHAENLMSALRFMGLALDWDYKQGEVHLYVPLYIEKELVQFQHPPTQHSLYLHIPLNSIALNMQIKRKKQKLHQ